MTADEPTIKVTYWPSYDAHIRQLILSFLVGEGSHHNAIRFQWWDYDVCPPCTYYSDPFDGARWPCARAEEQTR